MSGGPAYISLLASSGITLHRGEQISFLPSQQSPEQLRRAIANASSGAIEHPEPEEFLAAFIADARAGAIRRPPNEAECINAILQWHRTMPALERAGSGLADKIVSTSYESPSYSRQEIDELKSRVSDLGFSTRHVVPDIRRGRLGGEPLPFEFFEVGAGEQTIGAGCATTRHLARTRAVCEAIERIVAQQPDAAILCESADVLKRAGIHTPKLYLSSRDAFSESAIVDWIPAWTLDARAAAIPAELACYGYAPISGIKAFGLQHTAGLAAGRSLEAAIWRALCEVFERDAYWIVMKCRLCCPTIPFGSLPPDVQGLIQKLEQSGVRVILKDISLDRPIRIVHAIFVRTDRRLPAFSHGIGSHLEPGQAALKAITEGVQLHDALAKYADLELASVLLPSKNPKRVDLAWCDPASESQLNHLIDSDPQQSYDPSIPDRSSVVEYLDQNSSHVLWTLLGSWHGVNVVRVMLPGAIPPNREPSFEPERLRTWLRKCQLRYPYDTPILT